MKYKLWLVMVIVGLSGCTNNLVEENRDSISFRFSSVFYMQSEPHRAHLEINKDSFEFEECIVNATKKIVNLNTLKTVRVYKSVYTFLGSNDMCGLNDILLNEWRLVEVNPKINISMLKKYEDELLKVSNQLFLDNKLETNGVNALQMVSILGPLNHIAYINELSEDSINVILLLEGARYGASIDIKESESILELHSIVH